MQVAFSRCLTLRTLLMSLVVLFSTLTVCQSLSQSTQPSSSPDCSAPYGISPSLTANWTTVQKQILVNQVVPMIQKRIAKHWILPNKDLLFGVPGVKICVVFELEANGNITGAKMTQASQVAILDQSALNAVKNASPLDPFPKAIPVKSLSVGYSFVYDFDDILSVTMPYPLLSHLPYSFEELGTDKTQFPIVVSVRPSLTQPLAALKRCCLEKWAEAVQAKWNALASFSDKESMVEVEGSIEPDGTIDKLKISMPSDSVRLNHAATESIADNKLVMAVTIQKAVGIRVDFLAHESPDNVITTPEF